MISGRALIAWPVLVALLVMFGTAGFALTLSHDRAGDRDQFMRGLIPLWRVLGTINLVLSPLLLIAITAGMADTRWRQALPLVPEVLCESHAGRIWEWRLPIAAMLAVAAWCPLRAAVAAWTVLLFAGASLLLESLTSHAIDSGFVVVMIHFFHQTAAALWFGAVLGLWFGARHELLGAGWTEYAAPWVSRLAGWTVVALIMSGVFIAYHGLAADPMRVIYSIYGRTLIVKLGAASLVLLIGAYNRFVLMPEIKGTSVVDRLVRNVGFESLLLCGVVGIAAER